MDQGSQWVWSFIPLKPKSKAADSRRDAGEIRKFLMFTLRMFERRARRNRWISTDLIDRPFLKPKPKSIEADILGAGMVEATRMVPVGQISGLRASENDPYCTTKSNRRP
jgi:hypothetical protein